MEQSKRTQLETLIKRMDADYGDAYDQAHAELKALVRDILKPSGIKITIGVTKTIGRNAWTRVGYWRGEEHLRATDVRPGPAAYCRAQAILAAS